MGDTPTTTTATVPAITTPASPAGPASANGIDGGSPAAPGVATEAPSAPTTEATPPAGGGHGSDDDIYDAAFKEHLAPEVGATPRPSAPPPAETPPSTAAPSGESQTTPPSAPVGEEFTDDQRQLLSRLHLTPEMVRGWDPAQRSAFLQGNTDREVGQQQSYNALKTRLETVQAEARAFVAANGQAGQPPDETGHIPAGAGQEQTHDAGTVPGKPPGGSFADQAKEIVDQLADAYGDEMKPLGDLMTAVHTEVEGMRSQTRMVPVMESMLAEMATISAVDALVPEYPSLAKADVRAKVVKQFEDGWLASPHRLNTQLGYLDRVRSGIRDAAKAVFGTVTEAAAQATLVSTTKDRLNAQPPTGAARGRPVPMSEDQVYDAAYEKHLAPKR